MSRTTKVRKYTVKEIKNLINGSEIPKSTYKSTTSYKIEKNIPIPEFKTTMKYPLLDMEIGDSFIVPLSEQKSVRGNISRIKKLVEGYNFITRTVGNRGKSGRAVRIWRI